MRLEYLQSAIKQFEYYKLLGDKTLQQLTDEQFHYKHDENSNSIAVIIQHMSGNMISRWTDIFTTDGEKKWRNRDLEFEEQLLDAGTLKSLWQDGWDVLFKTLNSINNEDFDKLIYIRNQGHSVIEAINRQLCHYSYHVGQIVMVGKMCVKNWQSLSIPKGESKIYNKQLFASERNRTHFTEEFLAPSLNSNKMEILIKDKINLLIKTPEQLSKYLFELNDDLLLYKPDANKWNIKEVIAHLIVCERTNWLTRIKLILTENDALVMQAIDMNIHFEMAQNNSLQSLLEQFKDERLKGLSELINLNLTNVDFDKLGNHPVMGKVKLMELISTWLVHDLSHLSQILKNIALYYKKDVGPFVQYLKFIQ